IHAREIAIEAGRQVASRDGLQLLDETVAVVRLRTARDDMGRLRLQRTYGFEVSDTGVNRLSCSLTLLGKRLQRVDIPPVRDNVVQLFH
ncbi:MAG: DUF3301 domain-containing protein, partial [Methylobacterium sp.]|nr:DUF3301 domain-containing protein [Methylobacterium sp.]